ncbi:MAG: antibiotic biosynthesis monooxygenase, partial [Merismopedia sp. SIO2A8]|nr:antibiotic biosynthesis monooxygenase [Merismopedia sp. SIO2A8]
YRVRVGRQEGYEAWIKGIAAAAREFEGHLGVSILRPQLGAQPDYVIVLQFDACDHLTAWLGSDTRKMWIERVKPLIQEQETIQILSGLESWFQLPDQVGPKPPKRYKQAILVWGAVTVVSLMVSPLTAPILQFLPGFLQLAVDIAITVILLSYVIMPQLTKWLARWLFA